MNTIPNHALQTLPEPYQAQATIDIKNQRKLALTLNLTGILLFLLVFNLMTRTVYKLRGIEPQSSFTITADSLWWLPLFSIILGFIFLIILHEAAHGLFFWIYTKKMPKFALHLSYAYAAAPDWYIRRNAYLVIALAPIVLITGLGWLLFVFVPGSWLMPLALFTSINIASSIGDLYVVYRLMKMPQSAHIQDEGDRMTFFVRETPSRPL
jgi:hypothetical protein